MPNQKFANEYTIFSKLNFEMFNLSNIRTSRLPSMMSMVLYCEKPDFRSQEVWMANPKRSTSIDEEGRVLRAIFSRNFFFFFFSPKNTKNNFSLIRWLECKSDGFICFCIHFSYRPCRRPNFDIRAQIWELSVCTVILTFKVKMERKK